MKLKSICLTALAIGWSMTGSRAEASRTDINPALIYGRAFLAGPELSKEDKDYLFGRNWGGERLPERFVKLIAGYDSQFDLVRQAAHSSVPCDWGIDMSAGPATLLPHLARVKAVALTTRLRVMWHLQNGRQDQACDELLAAFALARNVSRDGTLISTLVQMASESILCSTIAANFGHFSQPTLKRLANGLDSGPARRTVAECLPTEKAFFLDWTLRKVVELQKQNPGDDAKVMEGIHQFLGFEQSPEGDTNLWKRLTLAANGTSEGVVKLLREREQAYEKVLGFLSLPYQEYESQVQTFSAQFARSPNPFIAETVPPFLKTRQKEFRILAYLAMVHAAVEYKLNGEAGLKSVNDPCGSGPFAFRRFLFEGVDRGFELSSMFNLGNDKAVMIFVEKDGPLFQVDGNYPGRALPTPASQQ